MIGIADAGSLLGQLVLGQLLEKLPAAGLLAFVRQPRDAARLRACGVQVRELDETRPATLRALLGVERLLLTETEAPGAGVERQLALVDAARAAGVRLVACTSVLHADTSALAAAAQYRELEQALQASGLPRVLLRLGCCVEHYTAHVPAALEFQAVLGCAGPGIVSCASRVDYAQAIAAVLAGPSGHAGRVLELAGGTTFTLAELAREIARQGGRHIAYAHLSAPLYRGALRDAGVPEAQAALLVDTDVAALKGAFLGYEDDLERLIGRPATGLAQAVTEALAGCRPGAGAALAAPRRSMAHRILRATFA